MTTRAAPRVEVEQAHAALMVPDIPTAVAFYTGKLGFFLGFIWGEPATFAGVNLGHVQVFLDQGKPNPSGCSLYFVIGDADELYEYHRSNGVEIVEPPGRREWGFRDYSVRDLNGYVLTFGHRLLHTNERLGDGVASPHTKRTLDFIQELKRKHGIDYDSHAGYRFVEE